MLGILIASLILASTTAPKMRQAYRDLAHGDFASIPNALQNESAILLAYAISLIVLVALADPAPQVATIIASLILLELVIANTPHLITGINKATNQLPGGTS